MEPFENRTDRPLHTDITPFYMSEPGFTTSVHFHIVQSFHMSRATAHLEVRRSQPHVLPDTTYTSQRINTTMTSRSSKADETMDFGRSDTGRKVARQREESPKQSQSTLSYPHLSTAPAAPSNNITWKQPFIPQRHPFFAVLSEELRGEVISYLPIHEVAKSRRTCQEWLGIVDGVEAALTGAEIRRHTRRLKAPVDEINATSMPTDADTLLASLRVWTSIRGSFRNPGLSLQSLNKWFSHLAGGKRKAHHHLPDEEFQRWTWLAAVATQLQRRFNHIYANNGSVYDPNGDDLWWIWFSKETFKYNCPLNPTELRKLYNHIRDDDGGAITGPFHRAKSETSTFPGDYPGRYRLTPIRFDCSHKPAGRKGRGLRYPVRPVRIVLATLGLPKLPPHSTFCYYATVGWVFNNVSKSYSEPLQMNNWMRAAALEWVELF
jgi:hypothetical protein